jgi:hypothetical protein
MTKECEGLSDIGGVISIERLSGRRRVNGVPVRKRGVQPFHQVQRVSRVKERA